MATYMSFSTLTADIQNYLERGASAANDQTVYNQIPRFINAAERKIMQALKLQGTQETLASTLAQGVPILAKPDRWRQTVSMFYGTGSSGNARAPLFARDYEVARAYWPDDTVTDTAQPPLYYADFGYAYWLFVPTPPASYALEANLYMQPQLLDQNNQTNFFTNYTPNMLLYGSLMEAAPFLKADERLATWQNLYNFELQTLGSQDLQKILDRSSERDRP